jgi:hypothetical protein
MNDLVRTDVEIDGGGMMAVIERAARDSSVDIDKMERLLQMKERMDARHAEQGFNAALNAAQSELGRIAADSTNPQTRSQYASYPALDKVVRPIYTRHGFSLSFNTGEGAPADHVRVLCHVSHRDGHTRPYHADIPCDGKGAKGGDVMTKTHAMGSAFSYGQRYLLKLIFNIAIGQDDDGNTASLKATPAGGVFDSLDASVKAQVMGYVSTVLEYIETDDPKGAVDYIDRLGLDADTKVAMWSKLDSKTRTAIKKAKQA